MHNYVISWGKYKANILYVQKSKIDKIYAGNIVHIDQICKKNLGRKSGRQYS